MKTLLSISLSVFVLAVMSYLIFHDQKSEICGGHKGTVTIGEMQYSVSLATTPADWEKGLSGTGALNQNEGMLFLFPKPEVRNFWMKDMLYAIDIIWIDASWHIVGIERNVTPDTYPKTFSSTVPVTSVLEITSGFEESVALKVGDAVQRKCL